MTGKNFDPRWWGKVSPSARWQRIFAVTILARVLITQASLPGCEFPEEWFGDWYVQGDQNPVTLSKEDLGARGFCYRQQDQHYVIYNRQDECYQCYAIHDKHQNVLQFRRGPCQPLPDDQEELGDVQGFCKGVDMAKTHNFIRLKAENIECPFYGDFTFTYSEGSRECKMFPSSVKKCMSRHQVGFRFHSCSPDDRPEDTFISQLMMDNQDKDLQSLTCIGNWTSDDAMSSYLVGVMDVPFVHKLTDRLRCFMYRPTANGGFKVVQSEDASCEGLDEGGGGFRTMHLKRGRVEGASPPTTTPPPPCLFPYWATDVGLFQTFSLTSQYEFLAAGDEYVVSNFSFLAQVAHQTSVTKCHRLVEDLGDRVKLAVRVTAGCLTEYKCVNLYRRGDSVIEIQEGRSTKDPESACREESMDDDRLTFTTLIADDAPSTTCVADGHHNVTQLDLKGVTDPCVSGMGFKEFTVRCTKPDLVEFIQDCNALKNSEFLCLGGWEERMKYADLPPADLSSGYGFTGYSYVRPDDPYDVMYEDSEPLPDDNVTLGYMIAKRTTTEENAPSRVCIIYTYYNDTYSWTVDTNACLRNIRPGSSGVFKFNSTKMVSCSAFSTLLQDVNTIKAMAIFWLSMTAFRRTWSRLNAAAPQDVLQQSNH